MLQREAARSRPIVAGRVGVSAGQEPRGNRASGQKLSCGLWTGHWASSEVCPWTVESFFVKFNLKKRKKKKKMLDSVTFLHIPCRGWNVLGVALAGKRFTTCNLTAVKRRGAAWRGQRVRGRDDPMERGWKLPVVLTPAQSRSITSFFGGSNYFVAFKNSTVTTFFYD